MLLEANSIDNMTVEERLEMERQYAPTEVWHADGTTEKLDKPRKATPFEIALLEDEPWLMTGLEWVAIQMAGRINIMIEIGLGTEEAMLEDIVDVMPEQSKLWLTGWQQMVNDGMCWNTSGSVGRTAQALIDAGFLLLSPQGTVGPYSGRLPSRNQVRPGTPGSPAFVEHMMSPGYLAWISQIGTRDSVSEAA